MSDEQIATCPILILGNKIDKPGALSEDDVKTIFGLHQQLTGKVRSNGCGCIYFLPWF